MKKLHFFLTQKLRLDLAASFLVFVNFGLLIIAASDKLIVFATTILGKPITGKLLIPIMFLSIGITAWFLGYILDRFVNYLQAVNTVGNLRNPQIMEILENQKKIDNKLNYLYEEIVKK